jgi:hypothetical protein
LDVPAAGTRRLAAEGMTGGPAIPPGEVGRASEGGELGAEGGELLLGGGELVAGLLDAVGG